MPGFNRMGPVGAGPRTGRGNGICQGNGNPQKLGVGCGRIIKNGNQMGYNFRRETFLNSNIQQLSQNDLVFLKNKAKNMENNLNSIKDKISELEQGEQ